MNGPWCRSRPWARTMTAPARSTSAWTPATPGRAASCRASRPPRQTQRSPNASRHTGGRRRAGDFPARLFRRRRRRRGRHQLVSRRPLQICRRDQGLSMADLRRQYRDRIVDILDRVLAEQAAALDRARGAVAAALAGDRLVYVAGSGHSHLIAEEAFYRAGGIAAAQAILDPDLMLHLGAERSTLLEREEGRAAKALLGYPIGPGDVVFVASNSGRNAYPIEMALAAHERGATTVALTSLRHAGPAPRATVPASCSTRWPTSSSTMAPNTATPCCRSAAARCAWAPPPPSPASSSSTRSWPRRSTTSPGAASPSTSTRAPTSRAPRPTPRPSSNAGARVFEGL